MGLCWCTDNTFHSKRVWVYFVGSNRFLIARLSLIFFLKTNLLLLFCYKDDPTTLWRGHSIHHGRPCTDPQWGLYLIESLWKTVPVCFFISRCKVVFKINIAIKRIMRELLIKHTFRTWDHEERYISNAFQSPFLFTNHTEILVWY